MACDVFVGAWKLVSYEVQNADGRIRYPFGRYANGYLIYTPEGFMTVTVMPQQRRPDAPPLDSIADPFSASSWLSWRRLQRLVRYVLAATRYISYSGRYTVTGDKVIHHIEVSQMPGLLHTDLERTYEIRGNCLVLTTQTPALRQQLVWERVPSESAQGSLTGAWQHYNRSA